VSKLGFTKKAALKLVLPVLVRASNSKRWRRVKITRTELSQLLRLRKALGIAHEFLEAPREKVANRWPPFLREF